MQLFFTMSYKLNCMCGILNSSLCVICSDITLCFNVSACKTVLHAEMSEHPAIKSLILLRIYSRSICLSMSLCDIVMLIRMNSKLFPDWQTLF